MKTPLSTMASSDPKQGGDLFDMAKDGTSMPNDAGKMNVLPSVPRPDQITDPVTDPNNLGSVDAEGAADNATDISRVSLLSIYQYLSFFQYDEQYRIFLSSLLALFVRLILIFEIPKPLQSRD